MESDLIAVLDVGKTHAKLLAVDALSGEIVWERQRVCAPVIGRTFQELDIVQTESWLIDALASSPDSSRIRHIVPIAHGAAAVLIDEQGNRLAAPDYEDPIFEVSTEAYAPLRDRFSDTYSPSLPLGLNLGRQWYFLQAWHRALWERTRWALLYPQYWAWRLSGVATSEITSLGCHSDLWRPLQSRPSDLALRQGWGRFLPPLRAAGEVVGLISPAMAQATGLHVQCRVYCGIHDSNAAYLCHLAEQGNPRSRSADNPFSVVSSGTWTVVLAQGAPLRNLQEPLDMLANLDAFGHPVATARFMGGREYAQIAGPEGCQSIPDRQALSDLINNHVMALPSFSSQGGPFAGQEGSVIHAEAIATDRERATLATLYTALMTDLLLDNLGAGGNLIIDGPLATNPLFGRILQTFRSGGWVYANHTAHAAAIAARFLVSGLAPNVSREPCVPLLLEAAGLIEYRYKWRSRIAELLSQRQNPILVEQ